jgi:hypothetical protein
MGDGTWLYWMLLGLLVALAELRVYLVNRMVRTQRDLISAQEAWIAILEDRDARRFPTPEASHD